MVPIAIVGQSCVLPGALGPDAFAGSVLSGQDHVRAAPAGRWGVPHALVAGTSEAWHDRTWSDAGGYVTGFERVWDPAGFRLPAADLAGLDPLVHWLVHCGRAALLDAGVEPGGARLARTGAVFGNLSFPSEGMTVWGQAVLLEALGLPVPPGPAPDPRNALMSGLPADLLARALGLGEGAFALDAACASSLYAIRLACDALAEGRADRMLAGAVNRADNLFLHVGFCALGAMSRTGQSRPFHRDADGLVPAEGCAMVTLERLPDAERRGARILGVIRGVGLSNDGRARNLLAPSAEGQERAMRLAYRQAGLTPGDIQLVECHATGTPTGDRTELQSLGRLYADARPGSVPIGSLKSMVGHLITVAGVAGLQKVLAGMAAGVRPPTLHTDAPLAELDGSPFRLVSAPEPWDAPVRRAAVSAFGFGGNNAHLVVEQHVPGAPVSVPVAAPAVPIAVTGLALRAGEADAVALAAGRAGAPGMEHLEVDLAGLRFPPNDLRRSLAQQALLFQVGRDAVADDGRGLDRTRSAVIVGMGADAMVTGWGLRWRIPGWNLADAQRLRDGAAPSLRAEDVVGTMPNIPANRLNIQEDIGGPSFTVSHEELSGVAALATAVRLLRAGELDVAVVGAVDIATDPRLRAALDHLQPGTAGADAAVVLVLRRAADVGSDPVYAWLEGIEVVGPDRALPDDARPLAPPAPLAGRPHAASGLLDVAAAALRVDGPTRVEATSVGGSRARVTLRPGPARKAPTARPPTTPLRLPVHAWPDEPWRSALHRATRPVPASPPRPPAAPGADARMADVTVLPPAPWLPPVSGDAAATAPPPAAPRAPALSTAAMPSAAMPITARAPAPPPPAAPRAPALSTAAMPSAALSTAAMPAAAPPPAHGEPALLAALRAHQAQAARLHAAFLEEAARTQVAFAEVQASGARALLAAAGGSLQAPPRPAAPAVAAPPLPAPPRPAAPAVAAPPLPAPPRPAVVAAPPLPAPARPAAPAVAAPPPTPARPAAPAVAAPPPTPARPAAPAVAAPPPTPARPAAPAVAAPPPPAPARPAAPAVAAPAGKGGVPAPAVPVRRASYPGPKLDRAALEVGASGSLTHLFGPDFAETDTWPRLVRMPEPPLLLADRVLGIEGPPRVLGKGTIWTETDLTADRWFLHEGRMPGGVLIESGQADLLLASWQGYDFLNRSERVYRLLGCQLTYHRELPKVGETLHYEIHVDGHAKLGDVRMFFFHYDCAVGDALQISVREGQAGFFTDAELAESGGVLWDPATAEVDLSRPHAAPRLRPTRTRLDAAHLEALAAGDLPGCFGPSHALGACHTWTPRIAGGRMRFLDRVEIDPEGGPWGRGHLRAEQDIRPDHWFFDGHFKNDPCMPGTLMFEGCLQAMQVYLAALGYTLERDGWRFEPAKDTPFQLRCRGQVIPTSTLLVYEIFVQALEDGPRPRLHAQVLCTVDGLKCFHADPLVLELVPDWPLTRMPELIEGHVEPKPVEWDWPSLLACAWGRPSDAFGPMYRAFDGERRVPRLPGPPYHFISRVLRTAGEMGAVKAGGVVDVEYDVPPDAWYFRENGAPLMPYAVLLEAGLQPCGWLASWTGCALTSPGELLFRNLDGTATQHRLIEPDAGTLTTRVRMTQLHKTAGMIIVGFEVEMKQGEVLVYDLRTVFGFFPPEAFANQAGVGSTAEERAWLAAPSDFAVDLRARPARYFAGHPRLPSPMLCMLDRITGYWPQGGKAGLGKWRAEKDVRPDEWMFKAHFYADPVQPGSLGVEALIQLLQVHCIHVGIGAELPNARFEPIALGEPMTWKYRGQVTPHGKVVTTELDIVAVDGDVVRAEGHLWVDGKRIYSLTNLVMRVVAGPPDEPPPPGPAGTPSAPAGPGEATGPVGAGGPVGAAGSVGAGGPAAAGPVAPAWVQVPVPVGHSPTWTVPALPMMTMAMLALAAGGATALVDGVALRWLTFPAGPRPVAATREGDRVTLHAGRERQGHLHPGEAFFRARLADPGDPGAPPPLLDPTPGEDGATLYASGRLFHGEPFHVVDRVIAQGRNGATLRLRPAPPDKLLDGATHGVPHDAPERWSDALPPGHAAYPSRLLHLAVYGAPPTGPVRAEVRLLGVEGGRPRIGAWLYDGDRLAASFVLEEVLLPKGRLGEAPPALRRSFLQGAYTPGVSLARLDGDTATLSAAEARASDWLPGTLEAVYGTAVPAGIAARELEAARLGVHPRFIDVEPVADGFVAWDRHRPLRTRALTVGGDTVRGGAVTPLDLDRPLRWWRRFLGTGPWAGEGWITRLAEAGLADLVVHDPDGWAALRGRPVLYLANHESYLESVLFCCVVSALGDLPVEAMAKIEHRDGWLGRLQARLASVPGVPFPPLMVYFDQSRPESLPELVGRACQGRSLLVHVEGTRQLRSGEPVTRISSIWADTAVARGIPVVPVAFRGGVDGDKADVPVGPQDVHLGPPILPETLAGLPYAERRQHLAAAINALPVRAGHGPAPAVEPWLAERLGG